MAKKVVEGYYTITELKGVQRYPEVVKQHKLLCGQKIYITKDMQEFRCGQDSVSCWEEDDRNEHLSGEGIDYVFFMKGIKSLLTVYKDNGKEYV